MTKVSYTSTVLHTDDATFRAWGQQLSTALQACGLVKTADTGQVDWATVVRPGANSDGGYEIYRFDDALQSSRPIYLRLGYGTAAVASVPRLMFSLGGGTNGAGTLINTFGSMGTAGSFSRSTTPSGAGVTYVSHSKPNGHLVLAWNMGGIGITSPGMGLLVVERAKDDTGALLGDGVMVTYHSISAVAQGLGYVWPSLANVSGIGSLHLNRMTSTTVGGDIQVFRHYLSTPRVRNLHDLSYIHNEISAASQFSVVPFGSTAHNYLALGLNGGIPHGVNAASSQFCLAVLWED